jgi:signal transduction histidine kinase
MSISFPKLWQSKSSGPKNKETMEALWRLSKLILDSLNFSDTVNKIVNGVLTELDYFRLGYKIVVLCLPDEDRTKLIRIAASQTPETQRALSTIHSQLQDIVIPLTEKDNYCVKCFLDNKPYVIHDWYEILRPVFNQEDAKQSQEAAQIKTSMLFPIEYHQKAEGVMIFSVNKSESEVSENEKDLIHFFTDIVGLAVQNARLYTSVESTTKKLTEANDHLKNANVQLQELDKLKDEFVSLASHELRTPMTAIRGSLSTILEGFAGDISPQSREFLIAASNENDRLIRLVNNLLNISRIESGRFDFNKTPVNMNTLIIEVVNNLSAAAKEKNEYLKYEPNSAIPVITTDGDKIREVLINIVGNAIKFTHQGGVTIKIEQKDGMITTSINDTGSGIAPEDQEILFKKFSQARGSYAQTTGGTGLGLYICKIIIEGLKGKIWLESTVGHGSTFYFSLPIAP